jgi:hypothetical protein
LYQDESDFQRFGFVIMQNCFGSSIKVQRLPEQASAVLFCAPKRFGFLRAFAFFTTLLGLGFA